MDRNDKPDVIGLPSYSVPELFPPIGIIAAELGMEIKVPHYVREVRNNGKYEYEAVFTAETVEFPFEEDGRCHHINNILYNTRKMIEEGADVLIVPRLETERYVPCPTRSTLPERLRVTSKIPVLMPSYYPESPEKTEMEIARLVEHLGADRIQAGIILEKTRGYLTSKPDSELDAKNAPLEWGGNRPRIALIASGPEKASLAKLKGKYQVEMRDLRELSELYGIPSKETEPCHFWFQIDDMLRKIEQLHDHGLIDGVIMAKDPYCIRKKELGEILRVRRPSPYLELTMVTRDFTEAETEGRLSGQNNIRLEAFAEMLGGEI